MASSSDVSQCRECDRLSQFLSDTRQQHPDYFCAPVPAFGKADAKLTIVGLAPGMHGANATGRPFTGDHAGILLYQTLHRFGFASRDESTAADDDLELIDCRITNAVKCLPPQNKPLTSEVNQCNHWLRAELEAAPADAVFIALGGIAHRAVIRAFELKQSAHPFGHAAEHDLPGGVLIDSYHCSRYNTQTRRLTTPMFESIFARARQLIS